MSVLSGLGFSASRAFCAVVGAAEMGYGAYGAVSAAVFGGGGWLAGSGGLLPALSFATGLTLLVGVARGRSGHCLAWVLAKFLLAAACFATCGAAAALVLRRAAGTGAFPGPGTALARVDERAMVAVCLEAREFEDLPKRKFLHQILPFFH